MKKANKRENHIDLIKTNRITWSCKLSSSSQPSLESLPQPPQKKQIPMPTIRPRTRTLLMIQFSWRQQLSPIETSRRESSGILKHMKTLVKGLRHKSVSTSQGSANLSCSMNLNRRKSSTQGSKLWRNRLVQSHRPKLQFTLPTIVQQKLSQPRPHTTR